MKNRLLLSTLACLWLAACANQPPMETVEHVDLERYMGDWYVIAHIPTFPSAMPTTPLSAMS